MPEWSWNALPEDPQRDAEMYRAQASEVGIQYFVFIAGPAGGWGMDGFQSLEELVSDGPLHPMPEDVTGELTAWCSEQLRPDVARLVWHLQADAVLAWRLFNVSAELDDKSVLVRKLDGISATDRIVLFDGPIGEGEHRYGLFAAFIGEGPGALKRNFDATIRVAARQRVRLVVRAGADEQLHVETFVAPSGDAVAELEAAKARAEAAFDENDVAATMAATRAALAIDPGESECLFWLAQCLIEQNAADDAIAVLDRLLASDPEIADAYYWRATAHSIAGRVELARRDAHIATELLGNDDTDVLCTLAEIELRAGNVAAALEPARRALEHDRDGTTRDHIETAEVYAPLRELPELARLLSS